MSGPILLTSFTTWKPEQPSNSSDDLLSSVGSYPITLRDSLHFLRNIPVDFTLAPQRVIQCIQAIRPGAVICCGMGEPRKTLDIESTAVRAEQIHRTRVNLSWLINGLQITQISHDAGGFVCNSLYFDVLDFLFAAYRPVPCIFVHVPRLSEDNQSLILQDFLVILDRVTSLMHQDVSQRSIHVISR